MSTAVIHDPGVPAFKDYVVAFRPWGFYHVCGSAVPHSSNPGPDVIAPKSLLDNIRVVQAPPSSAGSFRSWGRYLQLCYTTFCQLQTRFHDLEDQLPQLPSGSEQGLLSIQSMFPGTKGQTPFVVPSLSKQGIRKLAGTSKSVVENVEVVPRKSAYRSATSMLA